MAALQSLATYWTEPRSDRIQPVILQHCGGIVDGHQIEIMHVREAARVTSADERAWREERGSAWPDTAEYETIYHIRDGKWRGMTHKDQRTKDKWSDPDPAVSMASAYWEFREALAGATEVTDWVTLPADYVPANVGERKIY